MIRQLALVGVKTEDLLVQKEGWATHAYGKPHIGNQERHRFDFGNFNRLSAGTARILLGRLQARIPEANAVLVNQQVRQGVHTRRFREGLVRLMREFPETVFIVDSRHFSESYSGALLKINDREAARLCGAERSPGSPVLRAEAHSAARELFARSGKPVFVTRGSRALWSWTIAVSVRSPASGAGAGRILWAPGTALWQGLVLRSQPGATLWKLHSSAAWSPASPFGNSIKPEQLPPVKSWP